MKNRALIISVLILSCISLFAEVKRYEVKSAHVEYEINGSGDIMGMPASLSGSKSLIFKDYGALELSKEKRVQIIMGQKEIDEEVVKFDEGVVYSVDEDEKIIYKQKIPVDFSDPMLANKAEKNLESIGGKKIGTENIVGFTCTNWQLDSMSMCIYKGVPLKIQSDTMGIKETQVATSAEFNISLSDDKFNLPNYTIKSMSDVREENQKQMQDSMEGMSPEQKKMMENMMKNMGGMFGNQ